MTKLLGLIAGLGLFFANQGDLLQKEAIASFTTVDQHTCAGFVPENDLRIPVGQYYQARVAIPYMGGITEDEFNFVMDRIEKIYTPIVATKGGVLKVKRKWTDPTVNASAERNGGTYNINMYGGLARHQAITIDAMALVACHELGHHIGGAPKYGGFNSWASNEGQSDYFANLKCLRNYFAEDNNQEVIANMAIDQTVATRCNDMFADAEEAAICMRGGMAGASVSYLFQDLRKETTEPKFDTPDKNVVNKTNDRHPATQCRMDTYFNGSSCTVAVSSDVDDKDPNMGVCADGEISARPRCWYKPANGLDEVVFW